MQTKPIISNVHPSLCRKAHRWQSKTLAVLTAMLPMLIHAAPAPKLPDATVTTGYVYTAAVYEAKADFFIAVANANNMINPATRAAARKQASDDYQEALEYAKDQLIARRALSQQLNENRYAPVIDPAHFLSLQEIIANPNPFFPLTPGKTRHYRAETDEGTETVDVQFTNQTRVILGVTCIVVRDIVKLDGAVVEDTLDWYAQDRAGNVWYFGERVADYDGDGLIVSVDGSFEAGQDSALPGIIMPAQPTIGRVFRQEFFLGEAEDAAKVVSLTETVNVPRGTYTNCLQTEDFTPIEPGVLERKSYAYGIGNVLSVNVESGKRSELINITTP